MKVNIITRCTRPFNLPKIKESILSKKLFQIKWWIVFDTSKVSSVDTEILFQLDNPSYLLNLKFLKSMTNSHGMDLINYILPEIPSDEWIYILDDDNILHHNFENILDYYTERPIIIFNQLVGGRDFSGLDIRLAKPENMKVGCVDSAQFLIKRYLINQIPLHYTGDGLLIEELYKNHPDDFFYIDEVLSYYNSIVPKSLDSSPRVLVIGDVLELKSFKYLSYESDKLNALCIKDDSNINKTISEFNPDSILTIGDSYSKFPLLNSMSLDIRRRWLHFENSNDSIGESAYLCSSNYILSYNESDPPLVSIFTPIYNTEEKLRRTYESVKNQSYTNWEWVLVNDSDDSITLKIAEDISKGDARVKVYDFKMKSGGIVGESKYRAASLCRGKYLLELDHDDYLTSDAVYWLVEGFKAYPECKFVYSDCAEIYENHQSITYDNGFSFGYGSYRDEVYRGITYKAMNTSNINPKTIRHIVGVPNHFRAWDRVFYHSIGGHNRRLSIADDYELIVRTFLNTRMLRIPKMLYLQYYHNNNTQNQTRSDIQRRVRSISSYYNIRIKDRFKELGVVDWAFETNPQNPLTVDSRFGDDENSVNLIFGQSDEITYSNPIDNGLKYLF